MRRGTLGRLLAAALVAALVTTVLVACTPAPSSPDSPPDASRPTAPVVASQRQVERLLARRARAIEGDRLPAFLDTAARGPARRTQVVAFEALGRLPVARASYVVSSVERVGDSAVTRVVALLLVRLRGFDPRPVAATHLIDVVRARSGWRVRRDRPAPSQLVASPWALPEARVRTGDGVALVLDRDSQDQGDRLLRLLQEARAATRTYVPYRRRQGVVVLAPSNVRALRDAGFQPVEIRRVGGVVTGVEDRAGELVADRVVLVPEMLRRPDDVVLNLVRHELAHVAVGSRDAAMPLWIVEGLAEWASWRDATTFQIATSAVRTAEDGPGITRMPADLDFRSPGSGTAYGVAWFAMRWLEQQHGADAPYRLLDRLSREPATQPRQVSRILEREYGLTSDELARRAGELIAATFETAS